MARTRATPRDHSSPATSQAEIQVADVEKALNDIAPFRWAAEWDNVGLLAGDPAWPCRKVLLTIDLTDDVAQEALTTGSDTIIAYHPPIFGAVTRITPTASLPTRYFPALLASQVSIFALHTALDAAPGGTNDVLLDIFEPRARYPLKPMMAEDASLKLVVFVPVAEVDNVRTALAKAGAGQIGHYSECSYELRGTGTFRGDASSNPTVGRKLQLERVDEVRLEMILPSARAGEAIRTLYSVHSYEEPAFDLYPLRAVASRGAAGMGRVGVLQKPTLGKALCRKLAEIVDVSNARIVGNPNRKFSSITAAAGSFGVADFRDPDSLVVTGEFKHHDALMLQRRGICALYLEHWASERPVLDAVKTQLADRLPTLHCTRAKRDRSPFAPLARGVR
ncbi:MAG: YqfO family protein [Phycisphaerae bacterium]